jgi:hypothetical protein
VAAVRRPRVGRGGEVLVDEFDGLGVVAAVAAERAAERVIELVDVGALKSAVALRAALSPRPLRQLRNLLTRPATEAEDEKKSPARAGRDWLPESSDDAESEKP